MPSLGGAQTGPSGNRNQGRASKGGICWVDEVNVECVHAQVGAAIRIECHEEIWRTTSWRRGSVQVGRQQRGNARTLLEALHGSSIANEHIGTVRCAGIRA